MSIGDDFSAFGTGDYLPADGAQIWQPGPAKGAMLLWRKAEKVSGRLSAPKGRKGYTKNKRVELVEPQQRTQPSITRQFRSLADSVAALLSTDSERAESTDDYLTIIGLGPAVVPLLLRDLQQNGRPWFLALRSITRHKIGSSLADNVAAHRAAWITWGRERGHLDHAPVKSSPRWLRDVMNPRASSTVDALTFTVEAALAHLSSKGASRMTIPMLDPADVHCEHLAAVLRATSSWKEEIRGWRAGRDAAMVACLVAGEDPDDVLFGLA